MIDLELMSIVDCSVTTAGAIAETIDWIGGFPCVTVIFSINAAEDEDPVVGDGDWGSTGIIVRGVALLGSTLSAPSSLSTADMDLLDVTGSGAFEGSTDYATPLDRSLDPQLVGPTNEIKRVIRDAFVF